MKNGKMWGYKNIRIMDEPAKIEANIIDRVLTLAKKNVQNSKEKKSQKDEAVECEDLINKLAQ